MATAAVRSTTLIDYLFDDNDPSRYPVPKPGEYEITTNEDNGQRTFWVCCPGCATVSPLTLLPVVEGSIKETWVLSGTDDKPTLAPSINHVGCWHGWLRDGVFKLVGEP